jgi:3-oxoacyl-[acyl-carrier protein] reductase
MNPWKLESAIIPVTGAASGIGLAICKRLRAEGALPLLLDVNAAQLDLALRDVYADSEASRFGYVVDVRDPHAVDGCFDQLRRDHGPATHAVANAGVSGPGNVLELSNEAWQRVIDINLNGALYTCRAAARQMAEQRRGAIVTTASIAGFLVKENRVAYTVSKAGVVQMTRALAVDLGALGIRVNGVAPGVIDTPMQTVKASPAVAALADRSALKRLGTPDEIANVVLFLLSDLASYVSGHTIVADGGLSIRYS